MDLLVLSNATEWLIMTTPDGISTEDWDIVHQLGLDIVNASGQEEDVCRERLFEYLDKLEERYGELPSILATRADFLNDDQRKEDLLKRSYVLASARHDARNRLYAAHSLAVLYIDKLRNPDEGSIWIERIQQDVALVDDGHFADEHQRLRVELARLRG
jgi:hypothetical protein